VSAIVVGGSDGVGALIASGLQDRGWAVGMVDTGTAGYDSELGIGARFGELEGDVGPGRLVVDSHAARTPHHGPLAEMSDDEWDAACEAPLRLGWFIAVAAHDVLVHTRGRFVMVLPVGPLVGLAGQVALGAALEGLRGLVKSAARQWGGDGITVNTLAIDDGSGAARSRWPPALDRPIDARSDAASLLALIADPSFDVVTGATLVVDGGILMAP
jgi:3-oxoacyl-[acyl-carrier protein] reductase